jgi:Flp pilus assembly pilin Flp
MSFTRLANAVGQRGRQFLADETGGPNIEYGLVAALLSIVIIGFVTAFAVELNEIFNEVKSGFAAR